MEKKEEERKVEVSVLVVEDEPLTCSAIAEMLKRRVAVVYTAENGQKGLRLFQEHHPDIVITDIRMAVMDGLQMAQEIKDFDRQTPVIVISAYNEPEYLLHSINMGIDGYLLKPLDMEKLFSALALCGEMILLERKIRKQNEERDQLIHSLQETVASMKTLKGLIPICAACKKVRDDQGAWTPIEPYIQKHSEAEFSHGLCPGCIEKLYPRKEDGE